MATESFTLRSARISGSERLCLLKAQSALIYCRFLTLGDNSFANFVKMSWACRKAPKRLTNPDTPGFLRPGRCGETESVSGDLHGTGLLSPIPKIRRNSKSEKSEIEGRVMRDHHAIA